MSAGAADGAGEPRWSVIIATWNGRRLLAEALAALDRQALDDFETIVVDDASTDDTLDWLRSNCPRTRVAALPRRRGLAHALNQGLAVARGRFIAVLNNDAVPEPGWLAALDRDFAEHPEAGFLASRILLYDAPDRLHAAGDYYTRSGLPGNRGVREPAAEFAQAGEVFGACGAAVAYRRELFDEVGDFDEDLVMYCEDVDLDWRAQLAGYRCRYVPDARVRHRLGATGGGVLASYLVARNRLLVAVTNLPASVWRRAWWQVLLAQLRLSLDALRQIRGAAARASLLGQVAAIPLLWRARRKRRIRHQSRRVSDAYVWSLLEK